MGEEDGNFGEDYQDLKPWEWGRIPNYMELYTPLFLPPLFLIVVVSLSTRCSSGGGGSHHDQQRCSQGGYRLRGPERGLQHRTVIDSG